MNSFSVPVPPQEAQRPDPVDHAAVTNRAVPSADEKAPPPWWTEADDAELAALTWELVDGIFEHRPRCASCAILATGDGLPCPHITRAIEVVGDWMRCRSLQSYARWLRWEREMLEFRRDRARLHRGAA